MQTDNTGPNKKARWVVHVVVFLSNINKLSSEPHILSSGRLAQ